MVFGVVIAVGGCESEPTISHDVRPPGLVYYVHGKPVEAGVVGYDDGDGRSSLPGLQGRFNNTLGMAVNTGNVARATSSRQSNGRVYLQAEPAPALMSQRPRSER
jgi:hypothetical protein